ncbi:hypothetical protein LF599_07430 [Pseudodesulfovibrio thermohalotolerans]|uniref:hypothetical protein n=1 Tax=Pseudodesulfovibrio thermohalotolerans TaxID=2880651 RepID=UPI002441F91A|nr:hypothetical protein [Pseudodesulfovibrio thermohalotolerans]WFS63986.1 hypothetical protein LF599_07430 [Pseudodesulfovibrio thermohalotolerans]
MADKIGVELDWGLLEPTIAVAVRRTRATMLEKCGSAQDGDEIAADFMEFLWLNRHKYDAKIAAQNTWADAFLRNRSMQLVDEYRRDANRYVSLDSMSAGGGDTEYEVPDDTADTHAAAMASAEIEAALGDMVRRLNGDPVAQLVLVELAAPSPEVRAATSAYEAQHSISVSMTPCDVICAVYNLRPLIVSIAMARVRAVLSGQSPASAKSSSSANLRTAPITVTNHMEVCRAA